MNKKTGIPWELSAETIITQTAKYLNLTRTSQTLPPSGKQLADAIAEQYKLFSNYHTNRVFVVALGGAEGTAKTFLASEITTLLGKEVEVKVLAMDDYYKLSRKERKSKVQELKKEGKMSREDLMIFEISNDPTLSDFQLLLEHIKLLKQGTAIQKHFYNHRNGEIIRNSETIEPLPGGILIVEGIYALRDELKQVADLNVFVFTEEGKKYQRVSERDADQRAHGVYKSNKYFFEAQLPSYRKYIEPTAKNAGIIVNTTHLFD
jgi:uridine kinase